MPVAEFLRPLETVLSPAALDSALVRVVPMSRPVLRQPPCCVGGEAKNGSTPPTRGLRVKEREREREKRETK